MDWQHSRKARRHRPRVTMMPAPLSVQCSSSYYCAVVVGSSALLLMETSCSEDLLYTLLTVLCSNFVTCSPFAGSMSNAEILRKIMEHTHRAWLPFTTPEVCDVPPPVVFEDQLLPSVINILLFFFLFAGPSRLLSRSCIFPLAPYPAPTHPPTHPLRPPTSHPLLSPLYDDGRL